MIITIPISVFETRSHSKAQSRLLTRNLPGLAPPRVWIKGARYHSCQKLLFLEMYFCMCVSSVGYVWVLCEGARMLGSMCGCQRTTSSVDSQSFVLGETCLLAAFQCAFGDGWPGATRGFSFLYLPRPQQSTGIINMWHHIWLSLGSRDLQSGHQTLPVPRVPATECINVLLSRSLIPTFIFIFVCAVIEVSSCTYLRGCLTLPPEPLSSSFRFSSQNKPFPL